MSLRLRVREFLAGRTGGATPVEFVMIAPILIIIVFVVVQFILLAQMQTVLRQSAYAAARSALVHDCPPAGLEDWWDNPLGAAGTMLMNECTPSPEMIETAARMSLIAASSSSPKSEGRQGGACSYPEAVLQLTDTNPVRGGLRGALHHKACYAFEDGNANVSVEWQTQLPGGIQITRGPPPVKVTVTFRMPVFAPAARIFGGERRSDGTWYRAGSAVVVLL